jgi:hypothetical protein
MENNIYGQRERHHHEQVERKKENEVVKYKQTPKKRKNKTREGERGRECRFFLVFISKIY